MDRGGDARQNPRQRHQHLRGSVRRCVRGALAQRTRRLALLSATRSSFLPRPALSTPWPSALHGALPCHARDRWPQRAAGWGNRAAPETSHTPGRWLVRAGRGRGGRGLVALVEREVVGRRVWDQDGECLWTLLAQPTILASIVTHQALACSSASLARNQNLFLLLLLDPHLVHLGQHRPVSAIPV